MAPIIASSYCCCRALHLLAAGRHLARGQSTPQASRHWFKLDLEGERESVEFPSVLVGASQPARGALVVVVAV